MKSLEQLYKEILSSDELKKALAESVKAGNIEEFVKAHGVEATKEEIIAFLNEQNTKTGELSDEELENVAGGCNEVAAGISVITLGIMCIMDGLRKAGFEV